MSNHVDPSEIDVPVIQLGTYQHYKGQKYQVLGTGIDTETKIANIVYRPLYPSKVPLWIRPFDMFTSDIVVDGVSQPRFTLIEKE